MALWTDILHAATRQVRDTFPVTATISYTAEGTTEDVQVVFDRAYTEQGFDDGLAVTTTAPVVMVRDADVTRRPVQQDRMIIEGVTYLVADVRDEGSDTARCYLVEV